MITLRGSVKGVQQTVSALASLPSILLQAGEAAMTETLQLISRTVRDDFLQGPYPTEIERRSGSFRDTFRRGHPNNIWQVQSRGTIITGSTGSKDIRAHILNDGGVIRPTHGTYLAVRSDYARTPRGVVKAAYRGPLRQVPNTFVRRIRAPKAEAAVFQRLSRTLVVPIAWLVRSVQIIGRKFMQKTESRVAPQIPGIFAKRFQTVLDRATAALRRLGI